jgi:hypothetical protein
MDMTDDEEEEGGGGMAVQMVVPRAAADRTANGMKVEHGRTFRKLAGRATKTNNAHLHLRGLPSPLGIILYNMYYSLGIRGRTVPQNLYPSYVCAISPDVAKSPPPTQRPQHRIAPPRRTPAACHLSPWNHLPWPQIMAPKLLMSLMQAPGGAGSFSPLSFP